MEQAQETQNIHRFNLPPKSLAILAGFAIAVSAPFINSPGASAEPSADTHPPNVAVHEGRVPEILHPDYSKRRLRWLFVLRSCESHNNYELHTGNGFEGAYQFLPSTWRSLHTGYRHAYNAPPRVQDKAIVKNTFRSSNGLASQNPGCYYGGHGLSQFPPK